MVLSRCFRASRDKLGCVSCHDPHVLPSARLRVAWYRGRCLGCHPDTSCTLPPDERHRQNPDDSCIDCHMPRRDTSDVAHTAITDHRIVRPLDAGAAGRGPADFSVVPFHSNLLGVGTDSDPRDLGLTLAEMLNSPLPEPQWRRIARQACALLGPAVDSAPDDVAALEKLGVALGKDNHLREALAALGKALEQAPRHERTLRKAALVALELKDYEGSASYWQRLLAINPHTWDAHGFFAQTLAFRGQLTLAVDECREALRLNPFQGQTRMLLIDCLMRLGEEKQARAELDTLLALYPLETGRVRRWFAELPHRGG
jgi:predicted CXXCH cytochrome family protein